MAWGLAQVPLNGCCWRHGWDKRRQKDVQDGRSLTIKVIERFSLCFPTMRKGEGGGCCCRMWKGVWKATVAYKPPNQHADTRAEGNATIVGGHVESGVKVTVHTKGCPQINPLQSTLPPLVRGGGRRCFGLGNKVRWIGAWLLSDNTTNDKRQIPLPRWRTISPDSQLNRVTISIFGGVYIQDTAIHSFVIGAITNHWFKKDGTFDPNAFVSNNNQVWIKILPNHGFQKPDCHIYVNKIITLQHEK